MSNKERKKIHLVFAHDNIFSATAEGVFAEGLWGSPFWQRYLNVFSTVTVAARLLELPQNKWSNGFTLSSTPGVSNVELPTVDGQILAQRLAQIAHQKAALKIGQIGHLSVKYKGIDTALQALSTVRDRLPPFEFSLLGGGDPRPLQQKAEKLGLSHQTTFCGQFPPGEPVLRWLQDLDLYIQPSFQEGLPRALIEAMSQGCPALGSTAGGIPELLDHVTCLHKPGDSTRLAALLIQATTNNHWQFVQAQRNFETAKHYRKTGLDHIRNKFWQEFAESIRRQHL